MTASPLEYLVNDVVPLANQYFVAVDSQTTLNELHKYLFTRYALLERVIRARKLHHSHFYHLQLDYGHQHYLDNLQNQRFIVLQALGRLERRRGDVLYREQKWFNWIRDCQNEEDSQRDKESKRIKLEAALFKRHQREIEIRMKELRRKENAQQQAGFLEQAYQERLAQQDNDEDWDPIEDLVHNERANFLNLIRHFLWQDDVTDNGDSTAPRSGSTRPPHSQPEATLRGPDLTEDPSDNSKSKKSKKKPKNKIPAQEPIDKTNMETRSEMRKRLKEGSIIDYGPGRILVGSIELPVYQDKTLVYPDEEIDQLLEEIHEIKHLLFCRLLLSHAALLPAALRADSVEAFMNDTEICTTDLRDLCLKMEQPRLQDIRDACADLTRNSDPESNNESEDEEEVEEDLNVDSIKKKKILELFPPKKPNFPDKWSSEREKRTRKLKARGIDLSSGHEEAGPMVKFDPLDDGQRSRKMRVKICGRSIYNYPSEKAMTRGGWLHFSIIAKSSSLDDSIELCRHWGEFYHLSILSMFNYFLPQTGHQVQKTGPSNNY